MMAPARLFESTIQLLDTVRQAFGEQAIDRLIDMREQKSREWYLRELSDAPDLKTRVARRPPHAKASAEQSWRCLSKFRRRVWNASNTFSNGHDVAPARSPLSWIDEDKHLPCWNGASAFPSALAYANDLC